MSQLCCHAIYNKSRPEERTTGDQKLERVQTILTVGVWVFFFTPSLLKYVDVKEHGNILHRHSEIQAKGTNKNLNPPHFYIACTVKVIVVDLAFVFCCQGNHRTAVHIKGCGCTRVPQVLKNFRVFGFRSIAFVVPSGIKFFCGRLFLRIADL